MLEHTYLREQFESLLVKEKQAAESYGKLAIDLNDPTLREKLDQLCRDKHKHIRLTERLLEILD